jgi:uncharacterized protein
MDDKQIISATRTWVDIVVTGLNLCPFAKREITKERVRIAVTPADSEESLLQELAAELDFLGTQDSIATTLLIHPDVLQDFADYNQFLQLAEDLLRLKELEGIYQIASFHPAYQFAGAAADDVENYSNRSPFPMLHIINEASLEAALDSYPDFELIPQRNIQLLKSLGQDRMEAMLKSCFDADRD